MARRTIEMHHYRQALLRMRQGDSDRQIAAAKLMGRRAAAALRLLADERHWLDAGTLMPSDESIACALKPAKKASTTISSLEPHRTTMQAWFSQGVNGVVIQATLKRDFGWTGSYSAVRRMLGDFKKNLPPETTCRLDFEPGEAAQVDFGQGPLIEHPSGKLQRPWAFVMTLCFSRHQYVEVFINPLEQTGASIPLLTVQVLGSICFPCRNWRFGFQHWRGGHYRRPLIPLGFQPV